MLALFLSGRVQGFLFAQAEAWTVFLGPTEHVRKHVGVIKWYFRDATVFGGSASRLRCNSLAFFNMLHIL